MRLFIYCAGGIGRETYDIAARHCAGSSQWSEICFIDDFVKTTEFYSARLFTYENFKRENSPSECRLVIAHGEPEVRKVLAEKARNDKYLLESVIDSTARVSHTARLGQGVILFPYTYISSNAVIGDNVLISIGTAVGHDAVIGDNAVVSTLVSVSGDCSIGSGCYIGTTACIKEKVTIGNNTIIGMGSCVFSDVGAEKIALGNPVRELRANVHHKVFGNK